MEGTDLLLAGVLFLFAAVVAVPLAARLGIGAVLGYLLAGIAAAGGGLRAGREHERQSDNRSAR